MGPRSDSTNVQDALTLIVCMCYGFGEIIILGVYITITVIIGLNLKTLRRAVDSIKKGDNTGVLNYELAQDRSLVVNTPAGSQVTTTVVVG